MPKIKNDFKNISNSDYVWKCEEKNLIVKKSYSKSKRFIIRSIFFIGFFYIGFFSGMIGSKYGFLFLMKYMHITSLILCVVSFPISGLYLKRVDVVAIDTASKLIKHTNTIWRKTFKYNSSSDFNRKKSFIGGRFQAQIETLSIKSIEGRIHKIAKIAMPDKNGFQPIINELQKLESVE